MFIPRITLFLSERMEGQPVDPISVAANFIYFITFDELLRKEPNQKTLGLIRAHRELYPPVICLKTIEEITKRLEKVDRMIAKSKSEECLRKLIHQKIMLLGKRFILNLENEKDPNIGAEGLEKSDILKKWEAEFLEKMKGNKFKKMVKKTETCIVDIELVDKASALCFDTGILVVLQEHNFKMHEDSSTSAEESNKSTKN